ncbi:MULTISPECIES: FG-GAP-like repeat-containing protein [unclassified Streptomyces]|uniref:FG-GAP-like repeat-containing protein n=1 Tax=unclassified Streptomyces TaxID=2593676 RepID=UPI002E803D50|nr:FG-GAP-like repeat-containing protein [Streptomyces sp. NBC_00589]WTI38783.1 FG-GAP-like repeat-containing protein [Streptomyces sp. NBC_00775]WUB27537.1 FG-GAP-like repeat-containing protein [Streptomyces sp. NBC_00589]
MNRRIRVTLATAAATALTGGLLAGAATPVAAATATAAGSQLRGDFNGDGYRDVAIGVPAGTDGSWEAGWVGVVYGTSAGIDPTKRKILTQSGSVNPGSSEGGDLFGAGLSVADFDGDGYSDLAVGAPGEDIGSNSSQGTVTLYWGGPSGLGTSAALVKDPVAKDTNRFGGAITAGDFDGDGDTDLASYNALSSTVSVLHGPFTRTGTWASASTVTLPETSAYATGFLSSGNVSGDAADDLVVQYRTLHGGTNRAWYFRGSATGAGLVQEAVLPASHTSAVGDIDKDGYADIAVADAYETTGVGGAVTVLYGGSAGLGTSRAATALTQNSPGVPGSSESGDRFGAALSISDVTGDGYGDLAVGLPGEDVGSLTDAGSVVLLRGSATGIAGTGNQSLTQNTSGIPGTAESKDQFGSFVLLTDVNNNGRADLTAAAIGEAVTGTTVRTGAVWRLPGATTGLTGTGSKSFGSYELGRAREDQSFGRTLGG